jgi:hypothetical protein
VYFSELAIVTIVVHYQHTARNDAERLGLFERTGLLIKPERRGPGFLPMLDFFETTKKEEE